MRIADAIEHLANLLRDHYVQQGDADQVLSFLSQLALITVYREKGNLNSWDEDMRALFADPEWDAFEQRQDFPILESAWEVGRFNLYGAIQESETMNLYQRASVKISALTGKHPAACSSIDFSTW